MNVQAIHKELYQRIALKMNLDGGISTAEAETILREIIKEHASQSYNVEQESLRRELGDGKEK